MALVKYTPAEIDGVDITQKIERLLQDIDVFVDVDTLQSSDLRSALTELKKDIDNIQAGSLDLDSVLTEFITFQTLIDFNGNLLTTEVSNA